MDIKLRELENKAKATGNPEDRQRWLIELRRFSSLDDLVRIQKSESKFKNTQHLIEISREVELYEMLFPAPDKHVAPHTFELMALLAVSTRLYTSTTTWMTVFEDVWLSLLEKAELYDGQRIQEFDSVNLADLRMQGQHNNEGNFGMSAECVEEQINHILENPFLDSCITFPVLLKYLIDELNTNSTYYPIIRGLDHSLRIRYNQKIKNDLVTAISPKQDLEELHEKYIKNVVAIVKRKKVINPILGSLEFPDINSAMLNLGYCENCAKSTLIDLSRNSQN